MAYLTFADITDAVVSSFGEAALLPYFTKTDDHINDIAEQLDVSVNDIKTDPLPFTVKEYAIAYFCMQVCRDKTGNASVEYIQEDKYNVKYQMYRKEVDRLRYAITEEVLTGTVRDPNDRAGGTVELYRC